MQVITRYYYCANLPVVEHDWLSVPVS